MPFFIVLFFYITISIYQISAVADALKLILMVQSTFLEGILFIVSLFLTFTPLIGPILGIIGATFVWEWNIFFSALLFFWPYLIASLFFSGSELYTPSTLVPFKTIFASISIALKLAVESVVKYGLPRPAPNITMLLF